MHINTKKKIQLLLLLILPLFSFDQKQNYFSVKLKSGDNKF